MQKFLLIITLIISVLYVRVLTYPELELNKQEFFKASNVLTINNHCCNNTKFPLIATAGAITGEVFTGFTLAEVLITLLIIGVVASLVIPALIQDTQKAEYKVAYKKAFASATQAWTKAVNDYSIIPRSSWYDNPVHISNFNAFKAQFRIIKDCPTDNTDCWAQGENVWGSLYTYDPTFIDSSGMSWHQHLSGGDLLVDTNGLKPPNAFGKDRFFFWPITRNAKDINSGSPYMVSGLPVIIAPPPDIVSANPACPSGNCYYTSWLKE